jgi:ABC-type uncharacterized transport system involved in gliding motility auxiliary subunit
MTKKIQPTWRKYTFIALIVAGLALVSTILFLITRGLLGIGMFSGATADTLNQGTLISGGVTILALAVYAMLEPEKTRQALTGRQARYGSNAFIMSVAFIGVLVAVNLLSRTLTLQYPELIVDVTEDRTNTLAPEALEALKSLPEPVTAVAFYSANLSAQSATELLDKFKTNSKGKFDYRFVNPDTDPVAAREAGVTGDGKIMLVMGERREIANFASETELTKTLIKLINPEARAVYFLTGHGEGSFEFGDVSFASAKRTLENKNYTVNSLNLLVENKIPVDALSIIIAGPMKPVSDQEVKLLKEYVDAGGSLVVMQNPTQFTEFGSSSDPLAKYLEEEWGIALNDDVIIDLNSQQPLYAVSAQYSQHPITANLSQNYIVIMPQARSLSIVQTIEGITQTELILTSPNSWGEKNFTNAEGSQISPDPEDLAGPLAMAIAGENNTTGGRVVVFGNSVFASDQGFDAYGNGNMFINSVDWAAEQEDLLNITPQTPTQRTFTPPSQTQWIIILLGSVILLPGLVVLAGVSSWLARRRQG